MLPLDQNSAGYLKNQSSIVEGTRIARFQFIKKWIKAAIEKIVCLAITLRLMNGFYVCECLKVGFTMRY